MSVNIQKKRLEMVIINKAPDDIFSKEMTIQAVDFQSFYMYNSRKTDVIHIDCIFLGPTAEKKVGCIIPACPAFVV